MKYNTYEIHSVSSFASHVEQKGRSFFYRGQAEDWPLIPSIARVGRGGFDVLLDFEEQVLSEFRRLASPFFKNRPSSVQEWMLQAQHYGLPTRLLDWTTNPLKALFFAVEEAERKSDAVVWSFDAFNIRWNENLPSHDSEELYFHRPTHLNERIIAQESIFLVFPLKQGQTRIEPLQSGNYNYDEFGRIEKFIIPQSRRRNIKQVLGDFGLNSMSIYPGIPGAVEYIRDWYLMENA